MFAVYVLLAMYYKQSKVINLALLCWKGRGGKKEKYSQCLEREREKRNGNVQLKSVNLTLFNILMVELWESIIRLDSPPPFFPMCAVQENKAVGTTTGAAHHNILISKWRNACQLTWHLFLDGKIISFSLLLVWYYKRLQLQACS